MKTSELTGATLDWAVAKCMGHTEVITDFGAYIRIKTRPTGSLTFCPSTDWSVAGPIIEQEKIGFWAYQLDEEGNESPGWYAEKFEGYCQTGPTPLIAAMRCYVASKLGDEVELPEGLK